MSDATTPAGATGGNTTTSTNPELRDLPSRIRVHALARLLGASSRDVLDALAGLAEPVRGAQSSVSREVALRVAETLARSGEPQDDDPGQLRTPVAQLAPVFASASPIFLPPDTTSVVRPAEPQAGEEADEPDEPVADEPDTDEGDATESGGDPGEDEAGGRRRRRRGRRGRGRGKGSGEHADGDRADTPDDADRAEEDAEAGAEADDAEDSAAPEGGASRRRRRRRRRRGSGDDESGPGDDDPPNTVVHVRESRDERTDSGGRDEVRSVRGSTRLEAKRQRRRDGREAGRRRVPILSEAEFLARREAVDRKMVVRERGERIQIGVLEDGVLVEHFVTSSGSGSLVGNVYLGRVQNVLPSMEAAFVDIGRGRNAVLYAGEVDWDAAGLEGKARKIEQALNTGDSVLVQVTKDPVGHKGARLTTQISLPGRFLVYVPGGGATGISRKLPENERRRLKDILKRIVPEDAGVIIRTASEGISEEELSRDVRRLQAQWQVIKDKAEGTNGNRKAGAPSLLYEEPDLLIKVVRDLFTEDFSRLVVQGGSAWETIDAYVRHVAPDLVDRLRRHVHTTDVFTEYRIDEQLLKALDRKVWLPSGGYLIIDRTEAMTVIDVNTGKFTGSGGNLEETVTRNNLESAEEIVRQLRLRDIGGIIVIDFIDMVLESNRDLVLRRLTECLGRDRTRHQVAEVTSLGLVQMTRKRVGTGLLEAFSASCEHCRGRGVIVSTEPLQKTGGGQAAQQGAATAGPTSSRGGSRRGRGRAEPEVDTTGRDEPAAAEPVEREKAGAANAAADVSTAPGSPARPAARDEAPAEAPPPRAAATPAGDQAASRAADDVRREPEPAGGGASVDTGDASVDAATETGTGSPAVVPETPSEPESAAEPEPPAVAEPVPAPEPARPVSEVERPAAAGEEPVEEQPAQSAGPADEPPLPEPARAGGAPVDAPVAANREEQPEPTEAEPADDARPRPAEPSAAAVAEAPPAPLPREETVEAEIPALARNGHQPEPDPHVGLDTGLDDEAESDRSDDEDEIAVRRRPRRAASRPAGPPVAVTPEG